MKAIGIDIGTAFIASAQYNRNNISAKFVRDGFIKMPAIQQRLLMLKESKIPYIVKDNTIYVIGNSAFDLAVLFGHDLLRPLRSGVISAKEKETEFVLKEIIQNVAGQGDKGDIAYYSIPADPVDRDFNNIYHREMFRRFITEAGYKAVPLNEAMAIAYSELADKDFTGLTVSLGAGMTNVALSYKGLEIFSFSVAKSGDWIDEQVAKSRDLPTSDACAHKESKDLDLLVPKDDVEEAISIFYKAMLEYVVQHIASATEQHKRKIKLDSALSFVVAGGTTMPKGFLMMMAQTLKENPLPLPVGKVWQAKNPVMSVCRGCLIAAHREVADLEKKEAIASNQVHDISDGKNQKHQYPKPKPVVPDQPQVPEEPRTMKEKENDRQKANVMAGGFAEAINMEDI